MAVQTGRFTLYNAGTPLRLAYETAETNYADFSISSGGDLTIAPTGGDTNVTGNLAVSGGLTLGTNLPYSELNLGGNIVNADISASAEIAVSKLADGSARQLLQTDAAGTGVEWTSNVDVPGTLDVTGATTLDSTLTVTGDANFDSGTLFVDTANNRVGIGTSSPSVTLDVGGNIAAGPAKFTGQSLALELVGFNSAPTVLNTLRFIDNDNSSAADQQIGKIEFYSSDTTSPGASVKAYIGSFSESTAPRAYLSFATDTTTGTPTERMRITSDGYLRMASGSGGIQFNGDTAAANALDDYEEGTWTPAFTSGGISAITYTTQSGTYTKIGRQVICTGVIIVNTVTASGTSILQVTGQPFTSNDDERLSVHRYESWLTAAPKRGNQSGGGAVNLRNDGATGTTNFPAQNITAGSQLYFSLIYTVP